MMQQIKAKIAPSSTYNYYISVNFQAIFNINSSNKSWERDELSVNTQFWIKMDICVLPVITKFWYESTLDSTYDLP